MCLPCRLTATMAWGLMVVVALPRLLMAASQNEATTVALTCSTRPSTGDAENELAGNLLDLMQLALQKDDRVRVVERQQINLAIAELILDRSRPAQPQLKLSKLLTADLLGMIELRPGGADQKETQAKPEKTRALLRIVEPRTGSVRGVTAASIDATTVEETATQFAGYLSAVNADPQKRTVTVAVRLF